MKLPQPLSRRKVTFLLGGLLAAASLIAARGAELQQAAVTELYKTVSYQASAQAPQRPAAKGTVIHPTNIVRTGVDSRAELQFNDNTITRMGANSVFSFDQQSQTMDLSQGSVLFCKPKTSQTFEIATPAATCSISGTTGFVEYIKPNRRSVTGHGTMIFGLVEGRTTVTINGKQYPLRAGEMLLSTGGIVQKLTFNLLTFTQQAGLMKKFKSQLPNEGDIEHEVNRFVDLTNRGFIEPTGLFFTGNGDQIQLQGRFANNSTRLNQQPLGQIGPQVQTSLVSQIDASQILRLAGTGPMGGGGMPSGGGGMPSGGGGGGPPMPTEITGQLVWSSNVDLDLHLILPGNAGNVGFNNSPVTFNNGRATATLDVDNIGQVNGPNGERIENIVVSGTPASGSYQFYAQYFNGTSTSVPYTLTVTGSGATQTHSGTLSTPGGLAGEKSPILTVTR